MIALSSGLGVLIKSIGIQQGALGYDLEALSKSKSTVNGENKRVFLEFIRLFAKVQLVKI